MSARFAPEAFLRWPAAPWHGRPPSLPRLEAVEVRAFVDADREVGVDAQHRPEAELRRAVQEPGVPCGGVEAERVVEPHCVGAEARDYAEVVAPARAPLLGVASGWRDTASLHAWCLPLNISNDDVRVCACVSVCLGCLHVLKQNKVTRVSLASVACWHIARGRTSAADRPNRKTVSWHSLCPSGIRPHSATDPAETSWTMRLPFFAAARA